ncbi:MAG: hypothetical protein ACRD1X_07905 [Vicinamibacteria bacterium]
MQEGEDKEAFLAVYDEAKGRFIPLPPDLGLIRVMKNGKSPFCYGAVHTHRKTGGTLHLAVHPENRPFIAPILFELAGRLNRPVTSFDIYTNGVWGVTPIELGPGMHIKIVLTKQGARRRGTTTRRELIPALVPLVAGFVYCLPERKPPGRIGKPHGLSTDPPDAHSRC